MQLEVVQTLFFVVAGSLVLVGVIIFIMVFLFGLSVKSTLKDTKGIVGLLLLTFSIPAGVFMINNQVEYRASANSEIEIMSFESVELNDDEYLLTYQTSDAVVSYIMYKDGTSSIPVMPTYTLEKRTEHSIVVPIEIISNYEAFVVAGDREFSLSNN